MSVLVVAGLVGALVGSFLARCIHRLPRLCLPIFDTSLARCPSCGRAKSGLERIPVASWLLRRGRCPGCGARRFTRDFLVEVGTAVLFVHLAPTGGTLLWGSALTLAILGCGLIVCTLVDADWRVIPWQVDIPGFLLAPVFAFASPELFVERGRRAWWLAAPELPEVVAQAVGSFEPNVRMAVAAIVGAGAGALVIALVRWAGTRAFTTDRGAMGFDDVRFMAMIGGFAGWQGVAWTLGASSILAAVFGVAKKLLAGRDSITGRELGEATFLGYYALRLSGAPRSAPPGEVLVLGPAGRLAARLATSDSYMPYGPFLAVSGAIFIYAPGAVVALARFLEL